MKKFTLTIILTLLISSVFSQSNELSREKIEAYKKLYLSDKLNLNPTKENEFWKAYGGYEDSLRKLNVNRRKTLKKLRANNLEISDEDFPKMINNYMNFEKRKVELRGELISELKEVISLKKTMMLFKFEDDFRREMISKLKKVREKKSNKDNLIINYSFIKYLKKVFN